MLPEDLTSYDYRQGFVIIQNLCYYAITSQKENLFFFHLFFKILLFIIFHLFLNFIIYLFIYLWLCWAFSSCGKRGPLFIAVRGPLTIAASLVAEHRLQTRRLSNCGSWAQLLRGMWDLPRPGLEPVSPALAGRFSTTAPPGKPLNQFHLEPHPEGVTY